MRTRRSIAAATAVLTALGSPVSIATAPNGDIVVADAETSALRRLSYRPAIKAPVANFNATIDPATRTVSFDASLSTDRARRSPREAPARRSRCIR